MTGPQKSHLEIRCLLSEDELPLRFQLRNKLLNHFPNVLCFVAHPLSGTSAKKEGNGSLDIITHHS